MATNKELETGLVNGGTTYNQLLEILNGLWGISELNGWTVLRLGSKYTRYEMYAKAGTHILPVKFKETTIAYCAYTDGTIGSKVVKINDKVITVLKDCRIEITQISKGVLKDGGEGGRGEGGTISPEQQKLDEIWDAIHALQNQTASIATLRTMIEAEISARQSEFAQLTNSISSLDTRLNRVNEELQSKVDLDTYSNFKQSTNNTLTDHEQHLTDIDTKNDEQDTTLADHASHLETIDGHLDTIDSHLDTIDGHLDEIDAKNDEQDQTLSSHSETLSEHSTHLTNIDNQISEINDLDDAQNARLTALEAKPEINVAGTSNEITVSSNTSGNTKTFTVGIATDSKNKINTAYTHSQTQGNPHNTTIGDINGLQTELTSIESDLTAIESLIPDEATSSNKLADKAFVNSSITTNTATFRGTSAKNLTEAQFLAWANTLTKTKNDYVFWDTVDTDGNVVFKRYKYDGSNWIYEYSLNNSSFTASQWASINSGIVEGDVSDLHTHLTDNTRHITAAERTSWNSKASDTALQNEITNRTNADSALGVRIDDVESDLSSHESNNVIHITSTERTNWNAKATPSDITNAINALDVSDSAVTNQFVTKVSETDGKISVSRAQPQISDVKDLQTALNNKADKSTVGDFRTKSQHISMGDNLVVNGNGRNGDNYNFTSFKRYPTIVTNGAACSFGFNGSGREDEYMSCDFTKKILLSVDIKNLAVQPTTPTHRIYVEEYDIDKKAVQAVNVMYGVGTLTELTQDLKPGDTVVHLRDLSNNNWKSSTTYHRGFIFWNYKNSFGYQYEPETYSRNVYPTGDSAALWEVANVDQVNNTITLNSPWTGSLYPAGTKVSRRSSGGTYPYPAYAQFNDLNWHHLVGTMNGVASVGTSERTNKFSQGVAYFRVGVLPSNLTVAPTTDDRRAVFANLSVYELPDVSKGINGTLPIANGGTGATTAKAARYNLFNDIESQDPLSVGDDTLFAGVYMTQSTSNGSLYKAKWKYIWTYIANKISSVLGLTATNYSGKAAKLNIADTRSTNQSPYWYLTNHPQSVVTEFKQCSVIGLTGATYTYLTTITQWDNNSGGEPFQTAQVGSKRYIRYGTNDSTWSAWEELETVSHVSSTYATKSELTTHTSNTSNPHNVTKSQVGLGNVDNTSDLNKPISTATQTALNLKADKTELNNYVSKVNNTTLNGGINTTWQRSDRYIKVDGNGITYSVNPKYMGGYANNLLAIADNTETHNVIGVYGANGTYNYSFLGGTYSNPNIKLTKEGVATFKNAPLVPALKNSNGTYTYTFNASSGGELALTSQVNTKEPTFTLSYNSTTKRLKTTKSINII